MIKVEPRLELRTRIHVISNIIEEILRETRVNDRIKSEIDDVIFIINTGMRDNIYLKKVSIAFNDHLDRVCAVLSVEVDWDKYTITVSSGVSSRVSVDTSKPIAAQITKVLVDFAKYAKDILTRLNAHSASSVYYYADAVMKDDSLLEKVRKSLSLTPLEAKDNEKINAFFKEIGSISVTPDGLDEFGIKFSHGLEK